MESWQKWLKPVSQVLAIVIPLLLFFWGLYLDVNSQIGTLDKDIGVLKTKVEALIDSEGNIKPSKDAIKAAKALEKVERNLDRVTAVLIEMLTVKKCP